MISRRLFLGALGGAALGFCRPSFARASDGRIFFAQGVESRIGGRVGLFVLDTHTGRTIAHREDERFALCSTFKWVLAAAVLAKVDKAALKLDRPIPFGRADLIDHSPVTGAQVKRGRMTAEELARAAVVTSDNTAANLLLAQVGGPSGLTAFLQAHGDRVTRLDRNEPSLNTNLPGDPRDTTSPRAMVGTLKTLLTTSALSPESRKRLIGWMVACETGGKRLRAGFPQSWRAGDKTGTGMRGAANDVAIAWPMDRSPILVAAYLSESLSPPEALNSAHATLGQHLVRELGLS